MFLLAILLTVLIVILVIVLLVVLVLIVLLIVFHGKVPPKLVLRQTAGIVSVVVSFLCVINSCF